MVASYELTFGASFLAALFNVPFGVMLAWVLVRYEFPGRKVVDALVDLPFALPTAVAGIALTAIYAKNGWFGQWLEPLGIKVAYTPLGVWVALTFIGLPFVVRTVQPVLEELEPELEEASATLGADPRRRRSGGSSCRPWGRHPHRLRPGVRPRGRGIRVGHLYRRQPAAARPRSPRCSSSPSSSNTTTRARPHWQP